MQANQITPGQLLMDFLAKERRKIGEDIEASDFSRELDAQRTASNAAVSRHEHSRADAPDRKAGLKRSGGNGRVSNQEASGLNTKDEPGQIKDVTEKGLSRRESSPESGKRCGNSGKCKEPKPPTQEKQPEGSREKVEEELVFVNTVVLERIIARLKLSADVRQACLNAEDDLGRILCKDLIRALNQEIRIKGPSIGEGMVPSREVQELLDSLQKLRQDQTVELQGFDGKPKGFYNLPEFKELLQNIVQQVTAKEMKTPTDLTGELKSAATPGSGSQSEAITLNHAPQLTQEAATKGKSAAALSAQIQVSDDPDVPQELSKSSFEAAKTAVTQGTKSSPSPNGDGNLTQQDLHLFTSKAVQHAGSIEPDNPAAAFQSQLQQSSAGTESLGRSAGQALFLLSTSWPEELSARLREQLHHKQNQLTLELEPKHLGRITLRIAADENQVSTWVSTDNEQVKTLLLQNSSLLRRHLEEQGLMLSQFSVDVREGKGNQGSASEQRLGRRRLANGAKNDGPGLNGMPSLSPTYGEMGNEQRLISLFA